MAKVECINLDGAFIHMSDGTTLPITEFFDEHGDDCGPDNAVIIVAGSDSFGWLTIEILDGYKPVTVH